MERKIIDALKWLHDTQNNAKSSYETYSFAEQELYAAMLYEYLTINMRVAPINIDICGICGEPVTNMTRCPNCGMLVARSIDK